MKYDQLPVFKEAYDLTLQVYLSSQTMKREYKYTLGEKLKDEVGELQLAIYRASTRADKLPHIIQARETLESIRLKIRLMRDLKQLPMNNMARLVAGVESVSKQLTNWHRKLIKDNQEKQQERIEMQGVVR